MKRYIAAYCLSAFLPLTATTAFAADMVILESNVPSLVAGALVPESQAISLSGGQRLVVIANDGTTRAVAGPYSGPLGQGGSAAPGALERFTTERDDRNHVVGAIRAPSWELEPRPKTKTK